jgi:hypothetical protein
MESTTDRAGILRERHQDGYWPEGLRSLTKVTDSGPPVRQSPRTNAAPHKPTMRFTGRRAWRRHGCHVEHGDDERDQWRRGIAAEAVKEKRPFAGE